MSPYTQGEVASSLLPVHLPAVPPGGYALHTVSSTANTWNMPLCLLGNHNVKIWGNPSRLSGLPLAYGNPASKYNYAYAWHLIFHLTEIVYIDLFLLLLGIALSVP